MASTPSHLVRFGSTDLYVSRLCQGTGFRHIDRNKDDDEGQRVIRHCLELGVNFFDTAKVYGWGGAEEALGKALAGKRDQVVVCTKITPFIEQKSAADNPERTRYTRDYLKQETHASLKRLGMDYVDLLLLHVHDPLSSIQECVDGMDALVKAGKARYWGVSNHPAQDVSEMIRLAGQQDRSTIAGIEDYYNIAGETAVADDGSSRVRRLEREMFDVINRDGIGLIAYSPLDAGALAPGSDAEPDTPFANLLNVIDEVATGLGVGRAEVCVAWVLTHPQVTSVLAGSESPEHVEQNVAGARLDLPADIVRALNEAREAFIDSQEKMCDS